MSQPDRWDEFESFRETTDARLHAVERTVQEVEALARSNDAEVATAKGNTKLIQALRETQLDQGRILDEHSQTLAEHSVVLAEHGQVLDLHTLMLTDQQQELAGHGQMLQAQGQMLAEQGQVLAEHGQMLAEHGQTLAGILRILDERLPPKA